MQEAQKANIGDTDEKDDKSDKSILMSLMSFADSTTAHGFSRLAGSSGRTGSGLWLLFLLAAYAGLCYHTATLVLKFQSHPVSTSLIAEVPFQYPDIYLCSANPVGYSRITKSIQKTADYAYLYETNVTAYNLKLQSDVINNSAADVSLGIHTAWLNWQTEILSSRVNLSKDFFNSCRISLQGEEFTGNYTTALTYNQSLQPIRVPCVTWSEARSLVCNISSTIGNFVPNLNHSSCLYNSKLDVLMTKTVLGKCSSLNMILNLTSKDALLLKIAFCLKTFVGVPKLDSNYTIGKVVQGPFCFHRSGSSDSGLDINYCGVPYCSKAENNLADCSARITSGSSISTTYMGSEQTSRSGKSCRSWEALANGSLAAEFQNLNSSFEYRVFLPDPDSVASVGSGCRSAVVMFKDPSSGLGWQSIYKLIIDSDVENES
uniref:Acid-sensing ion channel 1-like n=1 Tax=Macrostomum lignano TaxID=282301 RepID=A0A1I8GS09_9PLAT